jgi:putative addiction module component (TIGR02574 family)
MSVVNDLLTRALALPPAERAALAHQLLVSLEPNEPDTDWEAAWTVELEARLAAFEQDPSRTRDWREALARMRQSLLS